jgi:polyisoprenoid-binding protein YceI
MTQFKISPERSTVTIDARSSLHPIHAETHGLTGSLEVSRNENGLDLSVPATGQLELDVSLLSSGNALYDREMMKRIDARRFRTITGSLTQIQAGADPNSYLVDGNVTCRGVTQPASDAMTIQFLDENTISLEGHHEFNVHDFGIETPKLLMLKVYPEVAVGVRIVAEAVT